MFHAWYAYPDVQLHGKQPFTMNYTEQKKKKHVARWRWAIRRYTGQIVPLLHSEGPIGFITSSLQPPFGATGKS